MDHADLLNLTGSVVLVTGASGGIGQGVVKKLADAGGRVIIHTHANLPRAKALEKTLSEKGYDCCVIQADLTKEAEIIRMLQDLKARGWFPTCVVNNAALQPISSLHDLSKEKWRTVFAANLEAVFLLTQKICHRLIEEEKQGAIVNIASIEGLDPAAGHAHYASSKAGLLMFTRAAAQEYGPFQIRVNAVSPGLIDRDGLDRDWPEGVDRWKEKAPLKRIGQPEDVANAVLFLLSPAARWISGANLVVDGGMTAQNRW